MTLVVARIDKGRIAIAADTLLTEHHSPLPFQRGTIKSCMLPGDICVSFSNSPVTAEIAFKMFCDKYRDGARYSEVASFFEESSARSGNDYIIAFSDNPKIVKVADGKRVKSISKTAWIGDQAAYERFREYETKSLRNIEHGRAMNAVLFADELKKSPSSDLYSAMRNVISDTGIPSVGGFVSVVSSRDNGFRFSVYSDMLFDWPREKTEEYIPDLNDPIALEASQENAGYSIAQISPGYMGVNLVAFYFVRGKKVFLFYGQNNGLPRECRVLSDVEAGEVQQRLNQFVGCDMKWLAMVTSGVTSASQNLDNAETKAKGMRLAFFTNSNTFPKSPPSST